MKDRLTDRNKEGGKKREGGGGREGQEKSGLTCTVFTCSVKRELCERSVKRWLLGEVGENRGRHGDL